VFRVDAVPDVHEMFAVQRTTTVDGEPEPFTRAQFDALRRETSVFTDAYAQLPQVDGRVDGRMTFGTFVTGNCFQVLGVSAAMGRALGPADDEPFVGQPVMVLSHRGWDRLFGRDPAIVGRHLRVNEFTFEIVGVMPEQFRGLTVTASERTSTLSVAVVSESTARTLWPNGDAIGQTVHLVAEPASPSQRVEPPLASQTFTVAGVVKDVAGLRIAHFDKAVVYVPTSAAMPGTSLIARVRGDPELARQTLVNRLTAIDPDMARQVVTMRTIARIDTSFLQIAFWLTLVLGGLALALTLSGLFGVLSYLVEQRAREIGVRMALGATDRDVTRLVLSQSIRPVGLGLFIGGGSAAAVAVVLLATPAAAGIGEIVRVLDPVAYAVSLLIIVAACLVAAAIPAARAARLDPALTLRQD